MKITPRRILAVLSSGLLAAALVMPAISYAEQSNNEPLLPLVTDSIADGSVEPTVEPVPIEDAFDIETIANDEASSTETVDEAAVNTSTETSTGESTTETEEGATAGQGDCSIRIEYYENVNYPDPDTPMDEDGRFLLGSRTLTGFNEGDYVNAWNYVANIPGYVFFDAWPGKLTVSKNPEDNVIKYFYFRLWTGEYTVNYYVMTGADLTADTWSGALATDDVQFTKLGSETFKDEPMYKIVDGDAYEYKLDNMYVIDTYPAEIRIGTDADNNVINVLYTPDSNHLPDNIEIPDDLDVDGGTTPPDGTLPDDETFDKDELIPILPDDTLNPANPGTTTTPGVSDIYEDFVGSSTDTGDLVITDAMLENTLDKDQAKFQSDAFQTGVLQGTALTQTGDEDKLALPIAIAVIAFVIIGFSLFMVNRRKVTDK